MRSASRCLLIAFTMLIPVSAQLQAKKAPRIPVEELVGIWVGFDEYGFSFTRLDLRSGFSGYVSQVGGLPGAYRINNKQYDGYHFTIDLVPISKDAESGVHVSGRSGLGFMTLQFRGNGWKREVRVFPQKRVEDSNRQAEQQIEAAMK